MKMSIYEKTARALLEDLPGELDILHPIDKKRRVGGVTYSILVRKPGEAVNFSVSVFDISGMLFHRGYEEFAEAREAYENDALALLERFAL